MEDRKTNTQKSDRIIRDSIMEKIDITRTKKLDLCVSCEICSAVCPVEAIVMENKFGQFLPKIDDKKCIKCGLCLKICPGIDVDPFELRYEKFSDDIFDGPCLESYTAYSNNPDIRKNSISGGLITALIIELIKNKEFNAAFVLPFDIFTGKSIRLESTNKISEIFNSAKSKYIPASSYNIIKTLAKRDDGKYIIVGTPCQIYGIKKYLKQSGISEENLLFLGLFCDKTLNFNIIRYFEDTYRKSNEKLIKFEFRTKDTYGWPGNSKVYFDSGRELIIDKKVRMHLKTFFQLKRCLFCFDKLNQRADISFGDCYITGKDDFRGKSSVVLRTKKAEEIFGKYSYLFTLEKESIAEIRKSQYSIGKKDNLEYAKIFIKEYNVYPDTISDFEINGQATKRLSKLCMHIKWGKNYDINKIRCSLFLSKISRKLRTIGKATIAGAILGILIAEDLFIRGWSRKRHISKKLETGNIIIVGGGLFNKGAQAMTFTVVDQIKRKFPHKRTYLLSTQDFERTDEEKNIYNFSILPWDLTTKIRLLGFGNKLFKKSGSDSYLENNTEQVIKNADSFIDISGYVLSSQCGRFSSVKYLLNIIIAKRYSIPYYIFPQSIGPFDYPLPYKIFLYPLMRLYLKYPEKIFPREEEGLKCLQKFTKKNVEKSYDIVLQNKEYNLANIYNKEVHFKDIKIDPDSVGIIPNLRVVERANQEEIFSVYDSLINRLIDAKKTVYILRHSYEDLEVCEKIKNLFADNTNVRLLSDDFNTIELEKIIKQFDFIIASRFHSIVHAYKDGVPALVIGWATKYFDLLKDFNQQDYFFDIKNNIDVDEIESKLSKLIQNYRYEKEKVINKMNILDKENIFNLFGEDKY